MVWARSYQHLGSFAALILVCSTVAAAEPEKDATTRGIMHSIFDPISTVLSYSFDGEQFSASKNRVQITAQLQRLADNVGHLENHAKSQSRGFEYIAKSLGRDARSALRRYQKGQYDEARFTLHNMTENCIACHSSLPETHKFPAAEAFFAKTDLTRLHPLDRASLLVMSRQFDAALKTYEDFFRSRDLDPSLVVVLGSFTDYLRVAIGVKNDLKSPQAIIEHLSKRPPTPLHVRLMLDRWLATLRQFEQTKVLEKTGLETPRQLLAEARTQMEFTRDRDALVHYVTVDALLTRYVHTHPDKGQDVAEAYYLLGITSDLLDHSFWLTRSDFYLESAIRLAPGATFAPKAYALLEENMLAGYSGSSGTHLPKDMADLLSELKKIVEQAQARPL